jgi:hypothetical protein
MSTPRVKPTGPHFGRRWSAELKLVRDGYYDLFEPDSSQPGAWLHRSCFFEFLLKHATKTDQGEVKFPNLCIICEVDVQADTLWRLWFLSTPDRHGRWIWVHPDCVRNYYR